VVEAQAYELLKKNFLIDTNADAVFFLNWNYREFALKIVRRDCLIINYLETFAAILDHTVVAGCILSLNRVMHQIEVLQLGQPLEVMELLNIFHIIAFKIKHLQVL
jgi:hypothetical protein